MRYFEILNNIIEACVVCLDFQIKQIITIRKINFDFSTVDNEFIRIYEEFDPGSERTLVECLIHASRAGLFSLLNMRAANG